MRTGCSLAARGSAGFTLLELAVVLVVLGLALAISAPAMPRPRQGADAAAHHLAGVLHRARRDAAGDARIRTVVLDAATGGYRVHARTSTGADSLLERGDLPLPGGVSLLGPDAWGGVARFNALGRAEGGPFAFRDAEGDGRVVRVDRFTGRVRIHVE